MFYYLKLSFIPILFLVNNMGCDKKYEPIFVKDSNNKSRIIVLSNDTIGYLVKDFKGKYIYLINQSDTLSVISIKSPDLFEYNNELYSNKKSNSETDNPDYKNGIFFTLYNYKHRLDYLESFDLKIICAIESHDEKIDLVNAKFWPHLNNSYERDVKKFADLESKQLYNPNIIGSNPDEVISEIEFSSKHFIDLDKISYSISLKYSESDSIKYFNKTDTLYRVFIMSDILISN